jgi:transposase
MNLKQHQAIYYSIYKYSVINRISFNTMQLQLLLLYLANYACWRFKCFNKFCIDIINVMVYKNHMRDSCYFTNPVHDWQRRYEALRASFVEHLPAKVVADRFGYTVAYIHLLRHQFISEKIDFSEPVPEGKVSRRRVNSELREKIRRWREHRLSAGEITQLLSEQGVEISVRTVERVLAEEGFPKLPRRSQLKIGLTVKGAKVPARSETITIKQLEGKRFDCEAAGVFLFAPFIEKFNITKIVKAAGLPGSKTIPATNYFLSFLTLKLIGTERYAHMGDPSFDPGLGLFAGLNVLPKCTAMSSYSYSLDEVHLSRLQKAFVKEAYKLGLYDRNIINLDFHTVPHYGDESVLEEHWAGARGKRMKGALTLFAQDAMSKLILYTAADIQKIESDDQVLNFLSFWKNVQRGIKPTFVFDSKFTTYAKLSELKNQGIKFITLRRRGKILMDKVKNLGPWKRINIPHAKRKYPNPLVYESFITLRDYGEELRQVIVKGNGHEKPAFLISNDFKTPLELLVGDYARRWRVENVISEAVKFFHLNSLSSPILIKVHFDIVMTMVADTMYNMFAQKLRGFEQCDAPKIYRHFVKGKANINVKADKVTVTFPRKAHNPILRAVPWHRFPKSLSWLDSVNLELIFK